MSRRVKIVIAVAGAMLAAGVTFWPIPYRHVAMLSGSFLLRWAIVGTIVGAAVAWRLALRPLGAAWIVAAGFVSAVIGRAFVEMLEDPTSHNLLPFEVVIALFLGLTFGWVGGVALAMARRKP